jgi:Flp pilus assembly protein TadG
MRLVGRSIRIPSLRDGFRQSSPGQAIVLIALIFIGLIGFVGLVVDLGTVLGRYAQLNRATDAAGVQASNQFRESRDLYQASGGSDIFSSVQQIMATQGFYAPTTRVRVYACINPASPPSSTNIVGDPKNSSPHVSIDQADTPQFNSELATELCFDPPRKLVRVDAETTVGLPFLSIVGWKELVLHAKSVGEAAAIDFVIVLDRSSSMASDTCNAGNNYGGYGNKQDCINNCSINDSCSPFDKVRSNAQLLIDRLKFPQDHVAIVQFDRYAWVYDMSASAFVPISSTIGASVMISNQQQARDVLTNDFSMQTTGGPIQGMNPFTSGGLNTNIGGGIRLATQVLATQGRRRNSVWMILLLTDGAPNATDSTTDFIAGFCPPAAWPRPGYVGFTGTITVTGYYTHQGTFPFAEPSCLIVRDTTIIPINRTCILTDTKEAKCAPGANIRWSAYSQDIFYRYDPDDYAHDAADYMASNGIVAFVIGLGPLVTDAPNYLDNNPANPRRDPDSGERLLRYVADMGYDPDVKFAQKLWPCQSPWAWNSSYTKLPTGSALPNNRNCGNYWYAAKGNDLKRVFEEIASRLFTRLAK